MKVGDTVRIWTAAGASLTGIIIEIGDGTETTLGTRTDIVVAATIRHRPQWPSMATERKVYMDIRYDWFDSQAQPVTMELIEPAAQPGPQLVQRRQA